MGRDGHHLSKRFFLCFVFLNFCLDKKGKVRKDRSFGFVQVSPTSRNSTAALSLSLAFTAAESLASLCLGAANRLHPPPPPPAGSSIDVSMFDSCSTCCCSKQTQSCEKHLPHFFNIFSLAPYSGVTHISPSLLTSGGDPPLDADPSHPRSGRVFLYCPPLSVGRCFGTPRFLSVVGLVTFRWGDHHLLRRCIAGA